MAKRKIKKNSKPSQVFNIKKSAFQILKEFIIHNFVALLTLGISVIVSVIIYYLSVLEPDIRPTKNEPVSHLIGKPIKDKDENCNYHASFKLPFKNLSWKSGNVDKVTFASESLEMLPKFELIEIDRSILNWDEEKDIEVKFIVKTDAISCAKLWNGEPLVFEMKFYDNKGRLLNKDINGGSFTLAGKWNFGKVDSN